MKQAGFFYSGWIVFPCLILSGCALGRQHAKFRNCRPVCVSNCQPACDGDCRPSHPAAQPSVVSSSNLEESNELVAQGKAFEHQQDYVEAIDLYRQALRLAPQNTAAHNALGICYSRTHRHDEARQMLCRAATLRPQEQLYRNNLAAALIDLGQYDAAYKQLAKAHGRTGATHNFQYMLKARFAEEYADISLLAILMGDRTQGSLESEPNTTELVEEIDEPDDLNSLELAGESPVEDEQVSTPLDDESPTELAPEGLDAAPSPPRNLLPEAANSDVAPELQPPRNVLPSESIQSQETSIRFLPPNELPIVDHGS